MSDHEISTANTGHAGLKAHSDARAVVKLIQCPICSRPLRSPVTLPCGNSLCRSCLPPALPRENISYPSSPGGHHGVVCPFTSCARTHPAQDCSVNVLLVKVMDFFRTTVSEEQAKPSDQQTSMEELLQWDDANVQDSEDADMSEKEKPSQEEKGHSRVLKGPRFIATFSFAELGELRYTSEISYHEDEIQEGDDSATGETALESLKGETYKEMDCHVCWNLILDPVSTPCGHTFCRKCLARILDHTRQCPFCRRQLPIPPSLRTQPSNKYLVSILNSFWPDEITARAEAVAAEESTMGQNLDTPLFVCTTGFPGMPLALHIFEPRYRLMIRRAWDGNRQFGMLAYNETRTPQPHLGLVNFMEVGTLLHIDAYQLLPDGRSLIICGGLHRFRVLAHDILDGYVIGAVQPLEDISLAEEEALEAAETSAPVSSDPHDAAAHLNRLSTQQLLEIGLAFVQRAHAQSARWLDSIQDFYGPPPNDAATFPYWFASVLPVSDTEKYKLLPTMSVRERLKITARWVHRIESARW